MPLCGPAAQRQLSTSVTPLLSTSRAGELKIQPTAVSEASLRAGVVQSLPRAGGIPHPQGPSWRGPAVLGGSSVPPAPAASGG